MITLKPMDKEFLDLPIEPIAIRLGWVRLERGML